jgi:hypothetical protein
MMITINNKTQFVLQISLLASFAMLAGSCDDMPAKSSAPTDQVILMSIIEPGDSGLQTMRLSHPVLLGDTLDYANTFLADAEVYISNQRAEIIQVNQDLTSSWYAFDRADFPIAPYDTLTISFSGTWEGMPFNGEASTVIISDQEFDLTEVPNDPSHGLNADTLMYHIEENEGGLVDVTAFYLDWTDFDDGISYGYQVELKAMIQDDNVLDSWKPTPFDRLKWLRDDEEFAWQWGPYPDLRSVPGIYSGRLRVSWGAFVFVDSEQFFIDENGTVDESRNMGYYEITLRRMPPELRQFYFSTHFWIRQFDYDPVDFNFIGENCTGIFSSCVKQSFRVAIVDEAD